MGSPATPLLSSAASSPPLRIRVVQEIFNEDDVGMHEYNLEQLDMALEDKSQIVVIEPKRLGDQTKRWIKMGNFLSQLVTVSGLSSLIITVAYSTPKCKPNWCFLGTLYGVCLTTHVLYRVSWCCDPCVDYQVENDPENLETTFREINGHKSHSSNLLVVLVRKENKRKFSLLLNDIIALSIAGFVGYKIFHIWND
uniref:Uncharacterized protein n=1 Tax=Romanomermis culicivorax TaxID=13658 RepID=A0A915KX31_ROMCU